MMPKAEDALRDNPETRLDPRRQPARTALAYLAFGLAIWGSASFSRFFSVAATEDASVIWPPLGIALAVTLLLGRGVVIVYALVIGAWFMARGYGPVVCLLMAVEQGGALLVMTLVTQRLVPDGRLLTSLGGALRFYALVPVATLLPFAAVATYAYYYQGFFPGLGYLNIWMFHWLSEALGVVLFAPPVQLGLLWLIGQDRKLTRPARNDLLIWLVFASVLGASLAAGTAGHFNYARGFAYLFFPLLIAISLSGRTLAVLLMLPVAVAATLLSVYFGTWQTQTGAWNAFGEALAFSAVLGIITQLVLASTVERNGIINFLREASHRDNLTGELNRRGLIHYVETEALAGDTPRYVAATLCLRNFAHARELLPDRVVDQCERWVARRIRGTLDGLSVPFALARVDSGIFSMVLTVSQSGPIHERLAGIADVLKGHTFDLAEGEYQVEPTMGTLTFSGDDSVPDVLTASLHLAREAMHTPGRPVHFGQDYRELLDGHRAELQQLEVFKRALTEDAFMLFGQEIRPLASAPGGSKMEFLVRMRGENGEPVSPGVFMPVASRFGYMPELDRWVIRNAFGLVAGMPALLARHASFSINLSGATLSDMQVLDDIRRALDDSGLASARFCFEVTETEQVDDWDRALQVLHGIKAMGFAVSLDDFGTGLASFDYLNRFPFDYIKIDGSFVRNLDSDERNREVVEAVVLVARRRGIHTIAEFVENEEIVRHLSELGVDYVQGFGIHKPAPVTEPGEEGR